MQKRACFLYISQHIFQWYIPAKMKVRKKCKKKTIWKLSLGKKMCNLATKKIIIHYSFWYAFVRNIRFDLDVKKCAIWQRYILATIHYSLWCNLVQNISTKDSTFHLINKNWMIFENRKNKTVFKLWSMSVAKYV